MPAPRANFACLAAKCQTDDGATVYELPVAATRCPVCGSKRVRRLFDAVQIGSGQARAHAQLLDKSSIPAQMDAARAAQAAPKETPVMKIGAGGALGAVQAYPGAASSSRGGTVPLLQHIRAHGKMRPIYG
jgi:hypothetical protein